MKIDVLPSFFFFVKKAKETERGGGRKGIHCITDE